MEGWVELIMSLTVYLNLFRSYCHLQSSDAIVVSQIQEMIIIYYQRL